MQGTLVALLPKYVFKAFMQDWLSFEDVMRLDTSMTHQAERPIFLLNCESVSHCVRVPTDQSYVSYKWMILKRRFFSDLTINEENWLIKPNINLDGIIFSKLKNAKVKSANEKDLLLLLDFNLPKLTSLTLIHNKDNCLDTWIHSPFPNSLLHLNLEYVVSCLSYQSIKLLFSSMPQLQQLRIHEGSNYLMNQKIPQIINLVGLHLQSIELSGWLEGDTALCHYTQSIEENCPLLESLSLSIGCDVIKLNELTSLLRLKQLSLSGCLFVSGVNRLNRFEAVTHLTISYSHIVLDASQHCLLSAFPQLTYLTVLNVEPLHRCDCRYIVPTVQDVSADVLISLLATNSSSDVEVSLLDCVDVKDLPLTEWEARKLKCFNISNNKQLFINIGRAKQPSTLTYVLNSPTSVAVEVNDEKGNWAFVKGHVYRYGAVASVSGKQLMFANEEE